MFEDTIARISDAQGQLGRLMKSAYFTMFIGNKETVFRRCLSALGDARSRLTRVQRALTDPLWVVLLGRFSAGKSTLINAFLQHHEGPVLLATGLGPTHKQATIVMHESMRTGMITSKSGVVQVEGLGLVVQTHTVDALEQLLLVDTPGLLDEESIDEALMEFVGHADVVLHCMTPDAELVRPDRELLEKRRKFFPSQVYNIVVTKAELHCTDSDGKFSETEWEKNVDQLASRYSALTKESLDRRPGARRNCVWLVDSVLGRGIPDLLSALIEFGSDTVDGVPRVREPVAKDRFGYLCCLTCQDIVQPLAEAIRGTRSELVGAIRALQEDLRGWEKNTLSANGELLALEIRSLQISAIPPHVSMLIATALGIQGLVEPQESQRAVAPWLLDFVRTELMRQVRSWRNSLCDLRSFVDIARRHDYHKMNYKIADARMEHDVVPAYSAWFDGARYGLRMKSLLGFDSVAALLPDDGPTGASQHDREDGDTPADVPLNTDAVESELSRAFSEGMELIVRNASDEAENSVVSGLWTRVRASLRRTRSEDDRVRESLAGPRGSNEAIKQIGTIVEGVERCVKPRIHQTVEAMRQTFEASMAGVRGRLAEAGVTVSLESGVNEHWKGDRKHVSEAIADVIHERFRKPTQNDLKGFIDRAREEVASLADEIHSVEENVHEELALDAVALNNSRRTIAASFEDWSRGFVAALKVFGRIDSQRNFFEGRGIGDDLARDLNAGLAAVHGQLLSRRRAARTQLIGSGLAILLLVLGLIATASETITITGEHSVTFIGVILTVLGVAVSGTAGALWKLVTFKRHGRADLARTIEEQLQTVCKHSRGNLATEKETEEEAFGSVAIAQSDLLVTLEYDGVNALARELLEQLRERLERLGGTCDLRRTRTADRIRSWLDGFCNSCRANLDPKQAYSDASAPC